MKEQGIIYKATNVVNNKCYIGKTTKNLKVRMYRHFFTAFDESSLNYNNKFMKAIREFGEDSFKWEIIATVNYELLNDIEIECISQYNSVYPNGYNMTKGGNHTLCDMTIHTFYHYSGKIEICTISELYTKHNLNASNATSMLKGKQLHSKGWGLNKKNLPRVYNFIHKNGTIELNTRVVDLSKKYNIDRSALGRVVKHIHKQHNGWYLFIGPTLKEKIN